MTDIAINIGLRASANYGVEPHDIAESRVLSVLETHGLRVIDSQVRQSNTELTFVAIVQDWHPLHFLGLRDRIKVIARKLYQDCIAVRPSMRNGELVGPYAELWGEFDPLKFIEPNY